MSNPPAPSHLLPSAVDSPATTSEFPIAVDLPCRRCNYNLRTRLPADHCPECNTPVHLSIEFARTPPTGRLTLLAFIFSAFFSQWIVGKLTAGAMMILPSFVGNALSYSVGLFYYILYPAGLVLAYALIWNLAPTAWHRSLTALLYYCSLVLFLLTTILASLFAGWTSYDTVRQLKMVAYGGIDIQNLSWLILQLFAASFLLNLACRPGYRSIRQWILPLFAAHALTLLLHAVPTIIPFVLPHKMVPLPWVQSLPHVFAINDLWLHPLTTLALAPLWVRVLFLSRQHQKVPTGESPGRAKTDWNTGT